MSAKKTGVDAGTNAAPNTTRSSDGRHGNADADMPVPRAGEIELTQEQRDAVAVLASHNAYASQSKWVTLRSLPREEKWPFFVQHFLLATVAVAVGLALVIALICTYVFKPPDPLLSVQAINMSGSSGQFTELKQGFDRVADIQDDRLSKFGTDLQLGSNSYADDSAKILPMVTAGDINIFVSPRKDVATLRQRELIRPVVEALGEQQAVTLSDAWVDSTGVHVSDAQQAVGLNLSKSTTWVDHGLPKNAVLTFSNLEHSLPYARQFIDYLEFK